jgi:methionyl aminopeptidase
MIIRKSSREIEKMRDAGRVVAEALTLLIKVVRPGITLLELDTIAERHIRSRGAVPTFKGYRGFPATLCVSANEQVVHGIPSARVLVEGDIISIDCGATLDGYVGDSAITLPVGEVSPAIQNLLRVTEESLYRGIDAAVVGARLHDISYAIQRHIEPHGFGIVREYCGHGVGRRLHEAPQIPNYGEPGTGPKLKSGWCLALEPMVNLGTHEVVTLNDGWTVVTKDHRPSAHFEHSIAITDEGPVILTDRRELQ